MSTSRLSRPVRRLLAFAIVLLVLAAGGTGVRLWIDARGQAVLEKYPSRRIPGPVHLRGAEAKKSKRVPVSSLAVFGDCFSTDPARKAEAERLAKELLGVSRVLIPDGELLDFVAVLKGLGATVPEGMTQAQAAQVFLRLMEEKYGALHTSLVNALAEGEWVWPDHDAMFPQKGSKSGDIKPGMTAAMTVLRFSAVMNAMTEARLLLNQPAEARAEWSQVASLAHQYETGMDSMRCYGVLWVRHWLGQKVRAGLSYGTWRDEDLGALSAELGGFDTFDTFRRSVEDERAQALEHLAGFAPGRPEREERLAELERPSDGTFEGEIKRLGRSVMNQFISDTQVSANAALTNHGFDVMIDQVNFQDGCFLPQLSENEETLHRLGSRDEGTLDGWYFGLGGWVMNATRNGLNDALRMSQPRLGLALEARRRMTGAYPDRLEELAPFFPGGVPRDPATGQPFFYEKAPEGGCRLWSAGWDQENDGGTDEAKDVVYRLPKPR